MNKKLNVFILAAGLGERLRPITNHVPKPLLPVLGKPLLQHILENLLVLPVNKIGINLHHKKENIENWIKQYSMSKMHDNINNPPSPPFVKGGMGGFSNEKIILFPEEKILGTGGALKNAESFLRGGVFLVHNADIYSEIDLKRLVDFHVSSENIATLAVHDYQEFNNVVIDDKGFLIGVNVSGSRSLSDGRTVAFTGIAVYNPEFIRFLPPGKSSIVDAWLHSVKADCRIGTLDITGSYWQDIGTPSSYASTVFFRLKDDGEIMHIDSSVTGCRDVVLGGHVVIEQGCRLNKGASFKNCIVLQGSDVKENLNYENCIIGNGFKVDLNEAEAFGFSFKDGRQHIGTGGSDRKYYRIKKHDKTVVLMQCKKDDLDFQRHIEYTRFFLKYSIPVPRLLETDAGRLEAVFEDAGDISLYSWLKCPRELSEIEKMYKKVIDLLILIHTEATEHVSECPPLRNRVFDYEHFRWETEYFIKRYVEGVRGIRIENYSALEDEFHRIALRADSMPKMVVHRDFQSQNIMVTKDGSLRLIDYQGARMGPPAYDIASILWDPYYRLEGNSRKALLNYYITEMTKKTGEGFDKNNFTDTLLLCRSQRHMQALGAYAFLSSAKGKKYFLKHIPEGLRLLKEDTQLLKEEYPRLYGLVTAL